MYFVYHFCVVILFFVLIYSSFFCIDMIGIITGVSPPTQYHSASRAMPSTKRIIYLSDVRYFCVRFTVCRLVYFFKVTVSFIDLLLAYLLFAAAIRLVLFFGENEPPLLMGRVYSKWPKRNLLSSSLLGL